MTNSQQEVGIMWKHQALSIIIHTLLGLALTLPLEVPRYDQLGCKHNKLANASIYNNSIIATTNHLGAPKTTPSPTPRPTPQFEYALLGQDSSDQHWYRVSLTPLSNKSGYQAQFALRKPPPYDSQQMHKHDKTIDELLNFLNKSEEQNLLKAYGQLLASEERSDEENKMKQNLDKIEVRMDNEVDLRALKTDPNQRLILVAESPGATPTNKQSSSDSNMVNNFVYFIKGLK